MKKEITIDENTSSNIADVLCFMRGFLEGKGDDYDYSWLSHGLDSISDINRQIK